MKKLLPLIISVLMAINVSAQEFAPIGAEWYYTEHFAMSFDISFLHIKSDRDTIIDNKNCKVLISDWLCGYPSTMEIIHFNTNKELFLYDEQISDFVKIMDFNAQVNDTFSFKRYEPFSTNYCDVLIKIDSVGSENINNTQLSKFNVTYTIDSPSQLQTTIYNGIIYEKIGDLHYLFNFPDYPIYCDMNFSTGLRCYSDSTIGLYETGIAQECRYTNVGLEDSKDENSIRITPNPANNKVVFLTKNILKNELSIFDLSGKLIYKCNFDTKKIIDISGFSDGIYLAKIKSNDNKLYFKKFIKVSN